MAVRRAARRQDLPGLLAQRCEGDGRRARSPRAARAQARRFPCRFTGSRRRRGSIPPTTTVRTAPGAATKRAAGLGRLRRGWTRRAAAGIPEETEDEETQSQRRSPAGGRRGGRASSRASRKAVSPSAGHLEGRRVRSAWPISRCTRIHAAARDSALDPRPGSTAAISRRIGYQRLQQAHRQGSSTGRRSSKATSTRRGNTSALTGRGLPPGEPRCARSTIDIVGASSSVRAFRPSISRCRTSSSRPRAAEKTYALLRGRCAAVHGWRSAVS